MGLAKPDPAIFALADIALYAAAWLVVKEADLASRGDTVQFPGQIRRGGRVIYQ